ncbi:hypothetical protein CTAYLR_009402 [Chrysophaeum taylorii]|uniref:Uncharacterized protein n=1 Tax=Chrysophaeum taylorii TaxID=2483200 RepID=A0AAD7ULD0_9STRA|nr:hypothetical protein CTAYLR_009402 [Chrysophaeum taylorii]
MSAARRVVVVALIVAAQEELFGGKKACNPYRCPKGQEPAPKRPLKLTSTGSCNGLGSGGGMSMFSAQKIDDPLAHCCDVRQACDQICGASLKMCDEALELCMNTTCASVEDKEDCDRSAGIHRLMTQLGDGCKKFVPAQAQGCQCFAPDKAKRRREQVLTDLYKRYAPDSVSKVKGLVKKATTPKKYATLLVKVVEKYPAAIKKVQDQQQAYFENILRKAKADEANKNNKGSSGQKPDPPPQEEEDSDDADIVDLDDAPPDHAGGDEL